MSDYISRQDAVDALAKTMPTPATPDGAGEFDHEIHIADEAFADAIRIIESIEPADVVPVVYSRWIKTADGAECEKCGREAVYQIVDDHWEYEPWCPHCGAKMDARGEE